jgi:HD-GYP domain-containing protein (c-di-GMP phosphodiesterase class II)
VKLELSIFVGQAAGLIYGLLNTYVYVRLKKANKEKNLYFKIVSYTFLALALIWFAHTPLSRIFEFKFAVDSGIPNYVLVFVTFILLIFRQVGYLALRISLFLNEKIDGATRFTAAVQTQMLKSLNALSLARDNETGNHIIRTQWYVKEIALKLMAEGPYTTQLDEKVVNAMFLVAPLRDIGKVGIPDSVLLKPDALDAAEWSTMKTHAMIGETILQAAIDGDKKHAQLLHTAIEIAGGHHEKWNGAGYPRGLSG